MIIYKKTQSEIGQPFLTCPESREGLRMLSNDIYSFVTKRSHESSTKFRFVSMLKIVVVSLLIAFGLSAGWFCFNLIIGG